MTSTGRGRSTYVDMILRLAALEGEDIHLDQAHVLFSDWPGPPLPTFGGDAFIYFWPSALGMTRSETFTRI